MTRIFVCLAACLLLAGQSLLAHEPHDAIDVVAVSPNFAQDQTVLAAFDNFTIKFGVYAILKSTDGGTTWSGIPGLPNNTAMVAVLFSPAYATDQTIFIAGKGGLFATTNQGASWSLLDKSNLMAMALSPNFATDNTLFVTTSRNTIAESTNRGQGFTKVPVPSGLTGGLTAIAVSPNYAVDHTLLLGTAVNGIFESTNSGATWTPVTSGMTVAAVQSIVFSPAYATDQTAFAGTYGSGMLVSTTAGTSWTASNNGLTDLNVTSVVLSPTYLTDSTIYVATAEAGVFKSNNRGAAWQPGATVNRRLSPQTPKHYRSLAATGNDLFVAMWEGLWLSNNGASTWQYLDTIPTLLIRNINLSPNYANDQTVFANTYGSGNLWSTDGGTTWTFQNEGMDIAYTDPSGLSPNYANDGTAFVGNADGLQKTTDYGGTWTLLQGGLGGPTYIRGIGISPNYALDSTLLIGTRNGPVTCGNAPITHQDPGFVPTLTGLFLSTDGGVTWGSTSLTEPVSQGCFGVVSAAMSPAFATDLTAFAASPDTGLYKSTDGGMNWTLLNPPSTDMSIVTVSPNYVHDQTVYAAGYYVGIYMSVDGGNTWKTLPVTGNTRVLDLRISPNYANDQTVYAATLQKGLVLITNGGTSVTTVTSFPDNFVTAVGMSPNFGTDRTIFAAGYHGLYKSVDGGITWTYTAEPARVEEARNVAGLGQQPPAITFVGGWSDITPAPLSSTNAFMQTGNSGDTATFNFVGTGVEWLTWIGPLQGSASIELDGVSEGTVSLNAPMDLYQQVAWQADGLPCTYHTVIITSVPGTGQTVSLDAFNVQVDGCAFPGFQPSR